MCPVVLKLQNRIKSSFDSNEKILIFGKHGHAEVIGLQGQTNNEALVFQDIAELDNVELPHNITLYSQTTKSMEKFYGVKDELLARGYSLKANDTICRQVSNRDKDLPKFVKQFDKIVFVSGRKSSNGKVLYEVCLKNNPNTFFISSASELDKALFAPAIKWAWRRDFNPHVADAAGEGGAGEVLTPAPKGEFIGIQFVMLRVRSIFYAVLIAYMS